MGNKGGLIFLGILAVFGLAAFLATKTKEVSAAEWHPVREPQAPRTVLENDQRIIIKRGPDRLIEEIIIHRKVVEE